MRQIYEGLYPINKEYLGRLPNIYAQVFAGEPWLEVSKCSVCGGFSGQIPDIGAPCSTIGCSGTYNVEAYPEKETAQYIKGELSKLDVVGIQQVKMESIRLTIEEVLAFGWGYSSASSTLAGEKYSSELMRETVNDLLFRTGAFFYISEVGVLPTQQGKGVGKAITDNLASRGKQSFGSVVLRTNENSPMRYIAENLGMKPVIGLNTGILDTENPMRVVFVGGKYERK